MSKHLSQNERAVWHRLVESHMVFSQALTDFFAEGVDRVSLMQNAFRQGDIATALYVAHYLATDELSQLLHELIRLATAPGYAGATREIIFSLPREWVLSNIEKAVEPILQQDATENEYRRMLELYFELDPRLTYRLAQRAIKHSDEDIKEAGEDFLEALSST